MNNLFLCHLQLWHGFLSNLLYSPVRINRLNTTLGKWFISHCAQIIYLVSVNVQEPSMSIFSRVEKFIDASALHALSCQLPALTRNKIWIIGGKVMLRTPNSEVMDKRKRRDYFVEILVFKTNKEKNNNK